MGKKKKPRLQIGKDPGLHGKDDMAVITENLAIIAAAAWAGYLQFGRGALIINRTARVTPSGIPAFGHPMVYVGDTTLHNAKLEWLGDDQRMINEYDPNLGGCCLHAKRGKRRFYIPDQDPSPTATGLRRMARRTPGLNVSPRDVRHLCGSEFVTILLRPS